MDIAGTQQFQRFWQNWLRRMLASPDDLPPLQLRPRNDAQSAYQARLHGYCCEGCGRTFNERTRTPYNLLEFPTDIVLLVVLYPKGMNGG